MHLSTPRWQTRAIHLDVWTGADKDTMARLGLGEIVPSAIVLDEQGEAISRIIGEAHEEDASSRIDWLLGGRVGTAPVSKLKRH